jgi:hypothetical protein
VPKYKIGDKVKIDNDKIYAVIMKIKPRSEFYQIHNDFYNFTKSILFPENPHMTRRGKVEKEEQEYVVTYHYKSNDENLGWGIRAESRIFGIYGLNENHSDIDHSDIDPLGEEDWNDEEKYIKVGDIVTCIRALDLPKPYNEYLVIGNNYKVNDIFNYYISLEHVPGFWHKIRFVKKIELNENHSDIDPFDEEDWNDNKVNVGDEVICTRVENCYGLTIGKTYKVSVIDFGGISVVNDYKKLAEYRKDRFKKIELNENHSDIDPFGEEEWDDENFKVGDYIICINDVGTYGITNGSVYKVLEVDQYGNPKIRLDNIFNIFNNNYIETLYYLKSRFKKTKINESVGFLFRTGQKVRINDNSRYAYQAYTSNGDGTGYVVKTSYANDFCYRVRWTNGIETNYRQEDLLPLTWKKIERLDIDPYSEDDWGYEK